MKTALAQATTTGLPRTSRRPTARGPLAVFDVPASHPAEIPESCPVVLIPGLLGSKEDFAPILRRIASRGHRAVAVDLMGQHESDGPAQPSDYAIEALAQDVLDVVSSLAEEGHGPAHLVGHSFGGFVARAAAIAAPEALSSVVLLGSGPVMIRHARETAIRLLIEAAGSDVDLELIWDALASARGLDTTSIGGSELVDLTDEATLALERERFLQTSRPSMIGMGRALLEAEDRTDQLAAARVPVLVLCGEHDDGWPPSDQQAMATRLGAEYREVPLSGHLPVTDNPNGTAAALLRWLPQHDRA